MQSPSSAIGACCVSSSAAEHRSRSALVVALVGAVLLVALVVAGRWEDRRWAEGQVRGMARVLSLVGPLDSPSLSGYRRLPAFDCLVYRRGENPFALEVCVDPAGRVVETIDRRRFDRAISSLRADPEASTLHVDRREVDRLLARMVAR